MLSFKEMIATLGFIYQLCVESAWSSMFRCYLNVKKYFVLFFLSVI